MTWVGTAVSVGSAVYGATQSGGGGGGGVGVFDPRSSAQRAGDDALARGNTDEIAYRRKRRNLLEQGSIEPWMQDWLNQSTASQNKNLQETYYGSPGNRSGGLMGQQMSVASMMGTNPKSVNAQLARRGYEYGQGRSAIAQHMSDLDNQYRQGIANQQLTGGINGSGMQPSTYNLPSQGESSNPWMAGLGAFAGSQGGQGAIGGLLSSVGSMFGGNRSSSSGQSGSSVGRLSSGGTFGMSTPQTQYPISTNRG